MGRDVPPHLVPRDPPLWVLDTAGSGGLAWVRRQDGGSTLYIGSGARLDALKLDEGDDGRPRVVGREDEPAPRASRVCHCTATDSGGLAAAVYAFPSAVTLYRGEKSHLYLIDVTEE